MSQVKVIDEALFRSVAEQAAASPRNRMNYNFHADAMDNAHRFLNVLRRGTYIRPHRHADPPKAESFLVLQGAADLILFNGAGVVLARYRLGVESEAGKTWGVDLEPGVWHTIVALTEVVVCFEVKPGPWEPSSDKEFAPWAPQEGEPEAALYLEKLIIGGDNSPAPGSS